MIRFYVRFASLLVLVSFAALVLIRAQPYDDRDLRVLLMPEGCEMPCFMGIRPGVTTLDEAVKLLEASGWVENLDKTHEGTVLWSWSGLQPKWLIRQGHLHYGMDKNGVPELVNLNLETTLTVGQIFLLYGNDPQYSWFGINTLISSTVFQRIPHGIYYDKYHLEISSIVPCPVRINSIWKSGVDIDFGIFWDNIENYIGNGVVFPLYSIGSLNNIPGC